MTAPAGPIRYGAWSKDKQGWFLGLGGGSWITILLGGVPLVAMQQNRWWPTADGPALDAGMFVVGLSYAAAAEPVRSPGA